LWSTLKAIFNIRHLDDPLRQVTFRFPVMPIRGASF
jgi:hypothetical protein